MQILEDISSDTLEILKNGKNLLAFSSGADSSALFFILESKNIHFDLAIIDYNKRAQSKSEVAYARTLAAKFNKICFCLESKLGDSNFECEARSVRYSFFYNIMSQNNYTNLITAHHFDDKLEWFFMRLSTGAGLNTLLGFEEIQNVEFENKIFYLIRPLINIRKMQLLEYNRYHNIEFYYDKSNENTNILRNFFRHNIISKLDSKSISGIKKSLFYLQKERAILYPKIIICADTNLFYCRLDSIKNMLQVINIIDFLAKKFGYVISSKQKSEIENIFAKFIFLDSIESKSEYKECILGDKIIIAANKKFLYVGLKNIESNASLDSIESNFAKIPKKIRDKYRKEKIPKKIRKIMYSNLLKVSKV